jgi:hypothetical protein
VLVALLVRPGGKAATAGNQAEGSASPAGNTKAKATLGAAHSDPAEARLKKAVADKAEGLMAKAARFQKFALEFLADYSSGLPADLGRFNDSYHRLRTEALAVLVGLRELQQMPGTRFLPEKHINELGAKITAMEKVVAVIDGAHDAANRAQVAPAFVPRQFDSVGDLRDFIQREALRTPGP